MTNAFVQVIDGKNINQQRNGNFNSRLRILSSQLTENIDKIPSELNLVESGSQFPLFVISTCLGEIE